MEMTNLTFVLWSLKGRYYGNKYLGELAKIGLPHLHSSNWHSKTDWMIAPPM